MLGDAIINQGTDLTGQARQNVGIGPVPEWVTPCSYAVDFKPKTISQVTHLLIHRQIQAEQRQTFVHTAVRLETIEAVQHLSQWRFEFEPRTQSLTLHWIKIRRGEVEFVTNTLDHFRLLQRESGLEGQVIDGWFTLLLLLEDVRPGDILDCCYTLENRPLLLPESCSAFFSLPPGMAVGKFQFSIHFAEDRPMKWKAWTPVLSPLETRQPGKICWEWMRENYAGDELEDNAPGWFIAHPWIQISDCPDWATAAVAVAEAWPEGNDDESVAQLAGQIKNDEPDPILQVARLIQLIQDEFRYLSVNIEFGGQVPSPCSLVARRRFGDCKDLSFFLVQVLKKLGFPARPILVNVFLGKTVAKLLPMPGLFNHVIVEFQAGGETRWVDPTQKRQGGGALQRAIRDYGFGLPVDSTATALIEPPRASTQISQYEINETILLDTTGANSCVAVVVIARGMEADILRHDFANTGLEVIAKNRLQACANRYGQATRVETLQYQDNREDNVFCLAEVFEINGFLRHGPGSSACHFFLPNDIGFNILRMPDKKTRKTPFALPCPCNVIHSIEIVSPSLPTLPGDHAKVKNDFVEFSRNRRGWPGRILVTFNLNAQADSVPADQVADYRKALETIRNASMRMVQLPAGHRRPYPGRDFGKLPDCSTKPSTRSTINKSSSTSPAPSTLPQPVAPIGQSVPLGNATITVDGGRAPVAAVPMARRTRQKPGTNRKLKRELKTVAWTVLIYLLAIGGLLLFLFCMYLVSNARGMK